MDLKVTYKHIESTPAIEEQIKRKSTKLKKYFNGRIDVDWICSVEGGVHSSDVSVRGDQIHFHATSSDDNLYKTFDSVIVKLERQLSKKNQQLKAKIHR